MLNSSVRTIHQLLITLASRYSSTTIMMKDETKASLTALSAERIFKNYYPRLCDFAVKYVHNEDVAEDLVQDAFLSFLEHKSDIENNDHTLKAFLYSCVKFACLNYLRHLKVKQQAATELDPDPIDDPQFIERMIHAEIIGKIHQAINELPKGCHLIFKEGYLEGLSNRDLAEKLGVSINTIKSQKQRGLMLLRRKLAPEVFTLFLYFYINS